MNLSDEIILIRKKGYCTQVEFAERIGVSFSTVNRWETGKMSPNVSTMKRLKAYCDALDIEFCNVEKAWLEKTSDHAKSNENKNHTYKLKDSRHNKCGKMPGLY